MRSIHVSVRLRPTRFAFLVKPNDLRSLRKIFEINTCLWGGKYNPIIPVFARIPSWWDRVPFRTESPQAISNGYLDYFEPDILVETQPGLGSSFGFAQDRIVSVDQLLADDEGRFRFDLVSHGTSVDPLYRSLYEREFQFSKRRPDEIVRVTSEMTAQAAMCACIFGAFPKDGVLAQLRSLYDEVFDPQELSLGPDTIRGLFERFRKNPLHFTHEGLEVSYDYPLDPKVFIFDATKPIDLIDYWNLRAGIGTAVPIPMQYANELSSFVKSFVASNYRPLPNNRNGVMIRPTLMFSRSISEERSEALFAEHFKVDIAGANTIQKWYPAIWTNTSEIAVSPTRPTLKGAESSSYISLGADESNIQFDSLSPAFAEKFGGKFRWANVVKLDDLTYSDRLATVYPENYRDPKIPNFGVRRGDTLPTREGYVVLADYLELGHSWTLETNTTAITRWLEGRGIKTAISGSGRATQQVVQTLGGLGSVAAIANPKIVQLLESMSRKPLTKSIQHQAFRNHISGAVKNGLWSRDAFRILVEQNAVEIGLEVCCTKCGSWSWYALGDIANQFACHSCLKTFPFPATDPSGSKNTRWAYRVIGPFAQPNYAQGGYAAALSMRFFSKIVISGGRANITWSAGQELTWPDGTRAEADFIIWYRRERIYGARFQTQIIFGETKSFGHDAFTVEDVARMKRLAQAFPGSVLVFSTMREPTDLSTDEIRRLASLAIWGRRILQGHHQSRAPVVVLTGIELFAEFSLNQSWEKLGGRHAELIKPAYVNPDNLRVLADMTQQLYLGMEPYQTYLEERWNRGSR